MSAVIATVIATITTPAGRIVPVIPVSFNAEELLTETVVKAMLMVTSNGTFIPVVASRNPMDGKRLQFSVNTSWYGNPVPCIKGTEFDYETHGVTIYWKEDGKLNKCLSTLSYFEYKANLSFLSSFNFLKGKTIDDAFCLLSCVAEYANAVVSRNNSVAEEMYNKFPEIRGIVSAQWLYNAISDAKGMVKKF